MNPDHRSLQVRIVLVEFGNARIKPRIEPAEINFPVRLPRKGTFVSDLDRETTASLARHVRQAGINFEGNQATVPVLL